MTRRVAAAALAVAALGLGGCSEEPRSYEDLSSLAAAVSEGGEPCDDLEPGAPARLVSSSATCGGSNVKLFMFDDARDLEAWKKVATRVAPVLAGSNWAVTGDRETIVRIEDAVGGETL